MLWSAESEMVRLISREIIFQEFRPIWPRYLNVTDRRTDNGQLASAIPRSAGLRAVKIDTQSGSILSADFFPEHIQMPHLVATDKSFPVTEFS